MRLDGFYWVMCAGEPEVWRWEDGVWLAPGADLAMSGPERVIAGPLPEPATGRLIPFPRQAGDGVGSMDEDVGGAPSA